MFKNNLYFVNNFLKLFPRSKKFYLIIFVILSCLSSFAEIVSISSVLLFVDVIINPSKIYDYFNFLNLNYLDRFPQSSYLLFFTVFFIIIIVIAAFIRGSLIYLSTKIGLIITRDLNLLIFKTILNQDFFLEKKNNINTIVAILTKVSDVNVVVNAYVLTFSSTFISIIVFSTMVLIDYKLTIGTTIVLLFFYGVIIFFQKNKLRSNSQTISINVEKKTSVVNNVVELSKQIILNNLQAYYIDKFRKIDSEINQSSLSNTLIAFFPGLLIVTITTIILILYIFFIGRDNLNFISEIPKLAALVFSAQRILPNIQQIYYNLTKSRAHFYSSIDVINFIVKNRLNHVNLLNHKIKNLDFTKSIKLKNITFGHDKNNVLFKNINLTLNSNENIVISGKSGIGKSSLVDLLIGILTPQKGNIVIDKAILTKKNLLNWQKIISFVPQEIFIFEGNFLENIALGFEKKNINQERVVECAKISEIHDFIISKRGGYEAMITHDGKDLSTGQKQRLGLARALYRRPRILFLDEALNAIDSSTEEKIYNNLGQIDDKMTIIKISHKKEKHNLFNCRIIIQQQKIYKNKYYENKR